VGGRYLTVTAAGAGWGGLARVGSGRPARQRGRGSGTLRNLSPESGGGGVGVDGWVDRGVEFSPFSLETSSLFHCFFTLPRLWDKIKKNTLSQKKYAKRGRLIS
jgi:hypothetical protein